jgi:hypothetical protein
MTAQLGPVVLGNLGEWLQSLGATNARSIKSGRSQGPVYAIYRTVMPLYELKSHQAQRAWVLPDPPTALASPPRLPAA